MIRWPINDPGDESDFPTCVSCDRKDWSVSEDGLCTACDSVIATQARLGLEQLSDYLAKYWSYQIWCFRHGMAA